MYISTFFNHCFSKYQTHCRLLIGYQIDGQDKNLTPFCSNHIQDFKLLLGFLRNSFLLKLCENYVVLVKKGWAVVTQFVVQLFNMVAVLHFIWHN